MDYWDKKLIRKQLSKKIEKLKPLLRLDPPDGGWINTLRESLGMTLEQLGNRVGLDKSRIYRIEKAEPTGKIKISTLEKVAEGLGMKFVYGFVPEKDLEEMVREQAKKIAIERMDRVDHSMRLESQQIDAESKKEELKELIEKILIDNPKSLWDK